MSVFLQGVRRWRWAAVGVAAVLGFAVLVGRFWHPYYGFTKFVQLDEADARSGIPEIREHPVFVYAGFNGYDGAAYTQIAFHPLLDEPQLKTAIGNVPYRARRILGSALAWLLAGGNAGVIANIYASLNIGVWLVLAIVLWRVLPVCDARSACAWAGVLFSAGALHAVRLALTDLLAATFVAIAVWLAERNRRGASVATLALAGLARETALLNVVGLWRPPWTSPRNLIRNIACTALVAAPLVLWMAYIRWKVGPADQGFGNFSWPVMGWIEKWSDTFADYVRHPDFRWLNTTTLLALVGVTVQAAYFLMRRRLGDPWWRVGIAGVVLMTMLGTSVWEGHPGAATRVLLPSGIAFAVLAVRERASWPWIVGGSLAAFSGVQALWSVPQDPRELAAGTFSGGAYVARLDGGWHGVERHRRTAWAWSAREGKMTVELAPRTATPRLLRLKVRAITPREIEVSAGPAVIWRGNVGARVEWIEVPLETATAGRLVLALRSTAPPQRENEHADARELGLALYGVELR